MKFISHIKETLVLILALLRRCIINRSRLSEISQLMFFFSCTREKETGTSLLRQRIQMSSPESVTDHPRAQIRTWVDPFKSRIRSKMKPRSSPSVKFVTSLTDFWTHPMPDPIDPTDPVNPVRCIRFLIKYSITSVSNWNFALMTNEQFVLKVVAECHSCVRILTHDTQIVGHFQRPPSKPVRGHFL